MEYIDSTWKIGGPVAEDADVIVDDTFRLKLDYAIESGLFIYGCAGVVGNTLGAVFRVDSVLTVGNQLFLSIEKVDGYRQNQADRLKRCELNLVASSNNVPLALFFTDPLLNDSQNEFKSQGYIDMVVDQLTRTRSMIQSMITDATTTPPRSQVKFVDGAMVDVRHEIATGQVFGAVGETGHDAFNREVELARELDFDQAYAHRISDDML